MLDILQKLKQDKVKSESTKKPLNTSYPDWVIDTPDSLSMKVYNVLSDLHKERQIYIKGHSKKVHYGAGTKGHWQLTKIEVARLVGYEVSSQVFVEKPFSKELCKHFDDTNEKLDKLKNKKFENTGFRNQSKEDIADDLSLLREKYKKLEVTKTKDLLDKSLEVIPIEVLKKLGLYNGPKSII